MADRVITVPQATQIAQATKGQLNSLNGRLTQVESINFSISVDANGNATLTRSDLVVTEEEDY